MPALVKVSPVAQSHRLREFGGPDSGAGRYPSCSSFKRLAAARRSSKTMEAPREENQEPEVLRQDREGAPPVWGEWLGRPVARAAREQEDSRAPVALQLPELEEPAARQAVALVARERAEARAVLVALQVASVELAGTRPAAGSAKLVAPEICVASLVRFAVRRMSAVARLGLTPANQPPVSATPACATSLNIRSLEQSQNRQGSPWVQTATSGSPIRRTSR